MIYKIVFDFRKESQHLFKSLLMRDFDFFSLSLQVIYLKLKILVCLLGNCLLAFRDRNFVLHFNVIDVHFFVKMATIYLVFWESVEDWNLRKGIVLKLATDMVHDCFEIFVFLRQFSVLLSELII